MLFILGVVLTFYELSGSVKSEEGKIKRNEIGKGKIVKRFKVETEEGAIKDIEIKVQEQEYSKREVEKIFEREIKKLDERILLKNESFDKITGDLNLLKQIPDLPIKVEWQLSRYDVLDTDGKFVTKEVKGDGEEILLKATLTYEQRQEEQAFYERKIKVYSPVSKREQEVIKVENTIREIEESTREDGYFFLPKEVEGRVVQYYGYSENRGITLLVCSLLIGILLFYKKKYDKEKMQKEREKQMLLDYPEIVSKIALLVNSGMILTKAWEQIVKDSVKEGIENRYAYEEMRKTLHKMELGQVETECYEEFGKSCKIKEYLKLSSLLTQNLRKGNRGLVLLLKEESYLAFDERKIRAKRNGEEAGTKLLLPTFLMLLASLLIVIVPAFLSIQI